MSDSVRFLLDSKQQKISNTSSIKTESFKEWFERVTNVKDNGILIPKGRGRVIYESIKHSEPLLFTGVPGTGKTKLAEKIADEMGVCKVFIPPLGGDSTKELIGKWDTAKQLVNIELARAFPEDNEKVEKATHPYTPENYLTGLITEGMARGCITIVDEINRYDPKIQNMLLHVTDKKEIFVPLLGTVKPCLGEKSEEECGFRLIATANENDVGTKPISSALLRRFVEVPFTQYGPEETKKILSEIFEGKECDKIIDDVVDIVERYSSEDDRIMNVPPLSSVIRAIKLLSDSNDGSCPIRYNTDELASLLTDNTEDFSIMKEDLADRYGEEE